MKPISIIPMTLVFSSLIIFVAFGTFAQGVPTTSGGKGSANNVPGQLPKMPGQPDGATEDIEGSIKMAKVMFVTPKDGETVPRKSTVKFAVEGLQVKKEGAIEPGAGHFHLIIDGSPIVRGEIIPKDAKHLHFADGQTEAKVTLPKGEHSLTLQFSDGLHRSYGEMMSQTIKVKVK